VNNWEKIWNKRQSAVQDYTLDDLIRLDGYDGGAGAITTADWMENSKIIADRLGLQNNQSIYEVGCGSGAFLKSLLENFDLKVGGIDYAEGLLNIAQQAIPSGNFNFTDASHLDITEKYDYVVSNGVFHYMSLEYAERVLRLMLEKAIKGVAILEVPDLGFKEESEKIRQDALPLKEYQEKYLGLEHTYFSRNWFSQKIDPKKFKCSVSDGCVPNYMQTKFRFNVFIYPV
jgi:trans-aconitate methyltransferase